MTRYKNVNGDVVPYTAEEEAEADILVSDAKVLERALEQLRNARTSMLQESDWMANSDVVMTEVWKSYRQQLRDLPSNYTTTDSQDLKEDLSNLEWPTKP